MAPASNGSTSAAPAGWRASLVGRLGLWYLPLATLLLVVVLAPAIAPFGLHPSPESVFAVTARTGVVEIHPTCERNLVWDLPAGRLLARNCSAVDPAECGGLREAVTATLAAGSSARIEMRADGRWGITFGYVERLDCPGTTAEAIRISADYEDVPADDAGYFYVAEPPGEGQAPPAFALPLAGRAIIGQFVEFGGGWSEVHSPTLSEGQVFGRDVAVGTGERLTLLDEELDPGSIVDTHPRRAGAGDSGSDDAEPAASGFVLSGEADMLVQVSQKRSIAVIPYDGVGRRLEIPRWKVWWNSPLLQLVASFAGVLGALLGLYIASQEGRLAYGELREQARSRAAVEPPAAGPAAAEPRQPAGPEEGGGAT